MYFTNENTAVRRRRHARLINRLYLVACLVFSAYVTWTSVMAYDHDELAQSIALVLIISLPCFSAALTYACNGDYAFFGISMVSLSLFIHWGMKCLILASEPELGHYIFLGFDSAWAYICVIVFATMLPATMCFGSKLSNPIRELLQRL